MKLGLFGCCAASDFLQHYETSLGAVLERLGIEFARLQDSSCCGYPFRNVNFKAFLLSSARNLALAEKKEADLVTACNCCYGNVKYVKHLLETNEELNRELNGLLKPEGLRCSGRSDVRHILEILYDNRDAISGKLVTRLTGLKVALHYGCHILRPSKLVAAQKPDPQTRCDRLVDLIGAERVAWKEMLQCCGAPVLGINDALSLRLLENKLNSASAGDADCLCVICPFCQIQFTRVRKRIGGNAPDGRNFPCVAYVQLLGFCLGIEGEILGLDPYQVEQMAVRATACG